MGVIGLDFGVGVGIAWVMLERTVAAQAGFSIASALILLRCLELLLSPRLLCGDIGGCWGDICADAGNTEVGSSRITPRGRSC